MLLRPRSPGGFSVGRECRISCWLCGRAGELLTSRRESPGPRAPPRAQLRASPGAAEAGTSGAGKPHAPAAPRPRPGEAVLSHPLRKRRLRAVPAPRRTWAPRLPQARGASARFPGPSPRLALPIAPPPASAPARGPACLSSLAVSLVLPTPAALSDSAWRAPASRPRCLGATPAPPPARPGNRGGEKGEGRGLPCGVTTGPLLLLLLPPPGPQTLPRPPSARAATPRVWTLALHVSSFPGSAGPSPGWCEWIPFREEPGTAKRIRDQDGVTVQLPPLLAFLVAKTLRRKNPSPVLASACLYLYFTTSRDLRILAGPRVEHTTSECDAGFES